MRDIIVVRASDPFKLEITKGAIPTPGLMDAMQHGAAEAYFVENTGDSKDLIPGVWYLHDEAHGYVSPDGKYTLVYVISS